MSLQHVKRLVFSEKQHRTGVQARLRKLRDHGYIGAQMLHNEAGKSIGYVYYLKAPAYERLDAEYKRRRLPKAQFLLHALDVVTIQVQLESWFSNHPTVDLVGFIPEWKTHQVKGGHRVQIVREQLTIGGEAVVFKPDAAFVLEHPKGRKLFFVEADRGTEYRRQIERKVRAYAEFSRHPERFQKKYNAGGKFGVLFITTKSEKRIRSVQQWNWDRPIDNWLMTTMEAFQNATSPTDRIWYKGLGTEHVPLVKV